MNKKFRCIIKMLFFISTFYFFSSISISETKAEVIGNIYSTNILAYIDNVPIKSYNIGGKTAIVLEDLENYGFNVLWKEDIRKLFVTNKIYYPNKTKYPDTSQIVRGTIGKIVGKIYSTDIIAIVNGSEVPSYNIGGKTVVCIEDLGNIYTEDNQNKQFGYSKYIMNSIWNENNLTISLNTFKDNRDELAELCNQYNITTSFSSLAYKPDFKYRDSDDSFFKMPSSHLDIKGHINHIEDYYKITLNGREIKSDTPLVLVITLKDYSQEYSDENYYTYTYDNYNIKKLKSIFEEESIKNPFVPLTKEDIVKGISKDSHINILNRVDIDDCIYLLCFYVGIMDRSYQIRKIDNNINMYTYINTVTFSDLNKYNQRVYYTDNNIRVNNEHSIFKNEDEKTNLYCLDFNTKEVYLIYSDYNIQVLDCYLSKNSESDIIQIQNSDGELIDLNLNDLLN